MNILYYIRLFHWKSRGGRLSVEKESRNQRRTIETDIFRLRFSCFMTDHRQEISRLEHRFDIAPITSPGCYNDDAGECTGLWRRRDRKDIYCTGCDAYYVYETKLARQAIKENEAGVWLRSLTHQGYRLL